MNWIETIVKIKIKLNENGYGNLSDKITDAQLVLGTPGEMFLNVIEALNEIKEKNCKIFILIEEDYSSLIQFAKDIGFLDETFNYPRSAKYVQED